MRTFMCTMVPGFEQVAQDELREKLPGVVKTETLRGKVFFSGNPNKEQLLTLDCVDNVYYCLEKLEVGPHKKDLTQFRQDMKRLRFQEAIEYLGLKETPCILVSASRRGKQTWSRFDLAECAAGAVTEGNSYLRGSVENHNLPVRIDVDGADCLVSVQITPAEFKYRGSSYAFMPGGIRPTIAAALIRLSDPQPEDVFYDPFCGSGTIPRERARCRARRIMASDLEPEAVESAKNNIPDTVKVFCCDAAKMKAADNSIDVIVSNIPWGKQIAVEDIFGLYTAFLEEADRVLTERGRMILLTDREEITEAAQKTGFSINRLYTVSLHGLLAGVYGLKRRRQRTESDRKKGNG